jgi:hypothetical protein
LSILSAIFFDLPLVSFANQDYSKDFIADRIDAYIQAAFDIAETHQPLFTVIEPSVQKFEDSASKNLFSKCQRQMMVLLIGCIFFGSKLISIWSLSIKGALLAYISQVPKRYDNGLELLVAHSTRFTQTSWLDVLFQCS